MNASGLQRNGRAVLIECIIAAFKPFCSKKRLKAVVMKIWSLTSTIQKRCNAIELIAHDKNTSTNP